MHKEVFQLLTLADTLALAQRVTTLISGSTTIGLIGDLGAGKTTFTKALLSQMGVTAGVSSPSFILENLYQTTLGEVSHWDLYRLKTIPDELTERLNTRCITIIEWIDKFPELVELSDITIKFSLNISGQQEKLERVAEVIYI